ncbi:MAG: FapA family protein [Leptospiraceae bacterium]|nr:FapA family protein [Leptospiraceae bacterium]MCP5512104.1 FapA family protein [Leptospiraceae bacterium]
MDKLKNLLFEQETELEKNATEKVEVLGDSIDECLKLASKHLNKPIYDLEYEVLKRGKKKFFIKEPYHIRVFKINHDDSIDDLRGLDQKLTGGSGKLASAELKELIKPKDIDGYLRVKYYRHGLYISVHEPVGEGKPVRVEDVMRKISIRGIPLPNEDKVRSVVEQKTGEYVRVGDAKLKPFAEATIKLDISQDKMKAYAIMSPPKAGGRDFEVQDVIYELKKEDIVYGIKEDIIQDMLENERYNEPILVASGDHPVKGNDAKIIYHVRIERNIKLKEDPNGKVDFKNLDLIENVVVGQLLAEKIPAEKGKYGRDLFNQPIEAKDGVDMALLPGKGTILSEDKTKLTAEVNGQAIFIEGKVNVETVYKVNGDVSMRTGNITFLGSIIVTGNVEDNFHIKASGNIEIYGTVQKAIIEADGDVIIRQGVTGRDEAKIISSNGNIVARFIQDANVITDKDVIVQEVIMNSNVNAGGTIVCNGKKAYIVGGQIRAGKMIHAKNIGSKSNPQTDLIVGISPKLLKQVEEYELKKKDSQAKLDSLSKSLKTIRARKEADPESFTEEHQNHMKKLESGIKKVEKRIMDYDKEIQTLQVYMEQTSQQGKVYFEKTMFPGVTVTIKNSDPFICKNEIQSKILFLENDRIKQKPYVDPESEGSDKKKKSSGKS